MAKTSKHEIDDMAGKITHEMVYEQCGTMKKYYDADWEEQYPKMLDAVVADFKKNGRHPTDAEIDTMIAGTVTVIEGSKGLIGPLCPTCKGTHDEKRKGHANPGDVADTFPTITAVIDEYNS